MDKEKKEKFERYFQILNEIKWINEVVEITNKKEFNNSAKGELTYGDVFNFNKEESFEFLHVKLNRLVGELKQLKIALYSKDVEIIRNLKSSIWCRCSSQYQYRFMKNQQSNMI